MSFGRKLAFSAMVVFLALPGLDARAQSGGILFVATDSLVTSRVFYDNAPGLCTFYVIHEPAQAGDEFEAVRFKMDNGGFTGVWVGDVTNFFSIAGNSQTGIAVSYGGCVQAPHVVLGVSYFCAGTSGCTTVGLAPDPGSVTGTIEVYDCNSALLPPPTVYALCVNATLVPDDTGYGYCDCTLPVESTTWGKIKGIYR